MTLRTQLDQICGAEQVTSWNPAAAGAADGPAAVPAGEATPLLVAPDSEEQLREVLRLATLESRRVLPAGAGEHLYAREVAAADLLLSTRRRARVVDYEPEDLTLVAQSGVTLHQLDSLVREHQQCLPVDCARGAAATVGGAIAGNRSGLDRLLQGTWRDHVLGARVLHADGTVSQTGSRVVKSVAGYDLAKLYVGSRGSLVFLLDVNLRLLCAPPVTSTVEARIPVVEAATVLQQLQADRRLQPSSILLHLLPSQTRNAQEVRLVVRFAGRPEVVAQQVEYCGPLLDGQLLSAADARQLDASLRNCTEPSPDHATLRLVTLPVAVVEPAVALAQRLDPESSFVAQYGVGTLHLTLSRQGIEVLQAFLAQHDAASEAIQVRWENLPQGWPVPQKLANRAPAIALQQALRSQFDPAGLFAANPPGLPSPASKGGGVGAGDSI